MRWLVAHPGPQFSVHDVYVGWVEALRKAGESVAVFDLDSRLAFYDSVYMHVGEHQFRKALVGDQVIQLSMNGLAAALYRVRPQILFLISGFFVDTDVLDIARKSNTTVVILNTESPYEDARQLKLAEHADLVLLNDPIHIDRFRQVTKTAYAPHAYRPTVHYPPDVRNEKHDFGFVGTGYPSRIKFMESMDLSGLDVVLGGNWQLLSKESPLRRYVGHDIDECVDNDTAADLYRSLRVGINMYRREADDEESLIGCAMGPREIEMAACGCFFLRDPRLESDAVLPMLPSFESPEDAQEKLHWYLARPDLREALSQSAHEAIQSRTFDESVRQLLGLFEERPVT